MDLITLFLLSIFINIIMLSYVNRLTRELKQMKDRFRLASDELKQLKDSISDVPPPRQ